VGGGTSKHTADWLPGGLHAVRANGDLLDMDKNALLEEYKSQRSEIQKRQEARTIILGFSITAIGTVMSLIITNITNIALGPYGITGLIAFLLMILITSTLLTIHHSKSIIFSSNYIACFIEPYFPLRGRSKTIIFLEYTHVSLLSLNSTVLQWRMKQTLLMTNGRQLNRC